MKSLSKADALAVLPPVFARKVPREALARKIVVLDDDPTGTQTVSGVDVAAAWDETLFAQLLRAPEPLFFVLTNTRSLPTEAAIERTQLIVEKLCRAARATGVGFSLVSRGDSTLRGHFPAETDSAIEVLAGNGLAVDATVLIPAFFEGGRFTFDDTHWLEEGGALLPVAQTEFARDPTLGFQTSHLPSWVEEKSGGRVRREDVVSLSMELVRGGPQGIWERLEDVPRGAVVIANAVAPRDLDVLAAAFERAERDGRRFLFRTAASFVTVYGGLEKRPLLSKAELAAPDGESGGLVVVGSHVERSRAQLQFLLERGAAGVEIGVAALLDQQRETEIECALNRIETLLRDGRDAVLFSSRGRIENGGGAAYLSVGEAVSSALCEVVARLEVRPRFLVAKGGITSSDVATRALECRVARVLGQVEAGVAVWKMGAKTRWPGLSYAVFPGNVGDVTALWRVMARFCGVENAEIS